MVVEVTRQRKCHEKIMRQVKEKSSMALKAQVTMGDSRKYPYHTTDGFSEFRGQGGLLELEIRRHGGILTSGILKAWGGLDLGFTQETDKNVFLESAFLWTF